MPGRGRLAVLAVMAVGLIGCEVEATSPDDVAPPPRSSAPPPVSGDPLDAVVSVEFGGTRTVRGTGVVLDDAGHVATVAHSDEATAGQQATVIPAEGEGIPAEVIGADPRTGLSVVRVSDPATLVPATLGDSDLLTVGDEVLVVTTPSAATDEPVPGTVRDRGALVGAVGMIEIDVAPAGGGAVATDDGEVLGLLASSAVGGAVEVGYALPVNLVARVAGQLIAGEPPTYPYLGVTVDSAPDGGVVVTQLVVGGPAEGSGLRPGDVITALNGRPVDDTGDLVTVVQQAEVGQEVTVTYNRGGAEHEASVTAAAAPE